MHRPHQALLKAKQAPGTQGPAPPQPAVTVLGRLSQVVPFLWDFHSYALPLGTQLQPLGSFSNLRALATAALLT